MPNGPRIIFKDDRDSSIQRGAVMYGAHFRPEMALIYYHAAQTAPTGLKTMVVSEGYRKIRDTRDLHQELRGIDLSLNTIEGDEAERRSQGTFWATRLQEALGPDYTVIVHGAGRNLHIHIELDP